jgi:putative tricarboxylic transport membrane protein
MFAPYILAHPLVLIMLALGVRWVLRIVIVPKSILFPVVLVLCVIGAYALGNTMKFGFHSQPFILGVILGDQIEINLVRAIMTDANPWLFLTRPISGGLLLAAVLSVGLAIWQHLRHQKRVIEEEPDF